MLPLLPDLLRHLEQHLPQRQHLPQHLGQQLRVEQHLLLPLEQQLLLLYKYIQ
jgi:hypothetical protein